MDPRVATAPTPGNKKFTKTNGGGSSCLLRQPSNKIVSKSRPEATAATETHRPNTCPVPTLTPQFHWNLNNSALKTLTQSQVNQLYGLFKFYDSSAVGDDLPSINCARLVEILRDARLINESSSCTSVNSVMASTRGLQVDSVERIFAQAVMGKMRVYLDADGQPALTFPLFCGALMNCAMLLTPVSHPEAALRQILPILLEGSIVNGHHISTDKGILGLFPKDGAISLEDFSTDRRNSRYFEHIGHVNTASTHVHESSSNSKTLRIFLLLGGDHDGAICCTLSLRLATREIVESEGIYYSAAPSEITRTTPVLPTQNSLTNALLLLKKCVSIKQERGFELRPANQLAVVDEMLLELKKREPRFSIALKPGPRASLAAVSMVNLSPANPADTMRAEEEGGMLASSSLKLIPALKIDPRPVSSSPLRQQMPLSFPKPAFNHQYELPGNYRDLVASWEVSKGDDCAWIHAVNAASPLKPASPLRTKTKPHRSGHLSPLRLPHNVRQDC